MDPVNEDIQHEMNRELGGREQAEINRRVNRAMRPADVPDAIVEKVARRRYDVTRLTDKYPENWLSWERLSEQTDALTVAFREAFMNGARGDLAAVYADIQNDALMTEADRATRLREGGA